MLNIGSVFGIVAAIAVLMPNAVAAQGDWPNSAFSTPEKPKEGTGSKKKRHEQAAEAIKEFASLRACPEFS